MITIIDYGLGNVRAFVNVYERLHVPVSIARRPDDLKAAAKMILPGVGSFDHAMGRLQASGMRDALDELVLHRQLPVLGVCVGMQMMAKSSEEGVLEGLGWIGGTVKKLDASALRSRTQLPHMGWNTLHPQRENPLLLNLGHDAHFYFLHSYHFVSDDPESTIAMTEYGIPFASALNRGNLYGAQFHPEKSHHWGIQLLKNFAEL